MESEESESPPIIVRFKKLGRQRCLGEADLDTHTITIDPRQHSRELLGTLIYECIHLLADDLGQPELHENKVSSHRVES